MKVLTAFFVICVASSGAPVEGQSLIDSARLSGGSSSLVIDVCGPIQSLADVMSQSDLVVHGRVVDVKVRLSDDEAQVNTEYVITPIQAFKDRRPATVATPGAVSKIVVRRAGGTLLTGDGLRLSTSVNIFPETESFTLGEEVVVFLAYRSDAHVYYFASGEYGAYRIRDGMVIPMTRNVATQRGYGPVEAAKFFDAVQRLR